MRLVVLACAGLAACSPSDSTPPLAPLPTLQVGYDAYRHLDQLPVVHIGDRAYMRSTYDRTGGNDWADASHFLREAADGTFVPLDVAGSGMLVFQRANHWHGSPWHWIVDGTDHVVQESSTATPDQPVVDSTYLPLDAFPAPLALTWSTTKGADLSWVPVPFTQTFTIGYGRTHYGTGYFIYHLYPDGADNLSTPVAAWDESAPPADVVDLLARAGTDIAPAGTDHEATVDLPASGTIDVLALDGPATIAKLSLDAPVAEATALEHAHLVIAWDGLAPSVDAPLSLLFGAGAFYDRNGSGKVVQALMASITMDAQQVHAALYFPMPFATSARVQLVGAGTAIAGVHVAVRTVDNELPPGLYGYFHATYVDHGTPVSGFDLTFLDTTKVEGGGDWCGSFVGTSFIFSDRAVLSTLEGDPRFFFDDSETPQAYGTGTEEWAGGGDYWGGQTMTLPLAGHPTGALDPTVAQNSEDEIESAYRFLIADAMPFGRNARIYLEHGGVDESTEHYQSVTYWYGRPTACLELTDTLVIGDPTSELTHRYSSPQASDPLALTSRFDGFGVDIEDPIDTELVRTTKGTSTFTVSIDPANHGVVLRRKLDYDLSAQAAEVWISDSHGLGRTFAGVWYLAGADVYMYSNPPNELDPPIPVVEVSGRRWREDEFQVPRRLTEGRSEIQIELHYLDHGTPLYPGAPPRPTGWSEARYRVYSYVL